MAASTDYFKPVRDTVLSAAALVGFGCVVFCVAMIVLWRTDPSTFSFKRRQRAGSITIVAVILAALGMVLWDRFGGEGLARIGITILAAAAVGLCRFEYRATGKLGFVETWIAAVCAAGVGLFFYREWPPSKGSIVWTLIAVAAGWFVGTSKAEDAKEKERDKRRAQAEFKRSQAAAADEQRRQEEEAREAEMQQARIRKARADEEQRLKAEREAEKEAERQADAARMAAQAAVRDAQEKALEEGRKLDSSMSTKDRLERLRTVLERVYDLADGRPRERVSFDDLVQAVHLSPGQALRYLNILDDENQVDLNAARDRQVWTDQSICITKEGVREVRKSNQGENGKYNFYGPTHNGVVGDGNKVSIGSQYSDQRQQQLINQLADAVREARDLVDDEAIRAVLADDLEELSGPGDKGRVVRRLAVFADKLGTVGLPILEVAEKFKQLMS